MKAYETPTLEVIQFVVGADIMTSGVWTPEEGMAIGDTLDDEVK